MKVSDKALASSRPGIFLDRDGTLIADRGDLGDPAQIEFLPGVVELLREIHARFALFIITNQPAVSAGRLTLEQVWRVNDAVVERLRSAGVTIERVFVCPHARADHCECIKPKPHFLHVAAREYAIDLRRSFTIGDHPHDAELATTVGATGIYVLTGHGLKHRCELGGGFVVVPSLADARQTFSEECERHHGSEIEQAAEKLRRGQVVAFPTETVYGLGANALYPNAVARIFEIKRRPAFDPLIVHIASFSMVDWVAREVSPTAVKLMQAFWPGPLTVVLPKAPAISDLVTSDLSTVAIRMPNHNVALSLLRACGIPVCAPSANPFGYVSPTCAEHVIEQLGEAVDCVIDGGACAVGIESTIVDASSRVPRILRPGAISSEEISSALGQDVVQVVPGASSIAPGMLPRHYSPRIQLRLFEGKIPEPPSVSAGLLLQVPRVAPAGYALVDVLSLRGNSAEAAHNLFATLRKFDKTALDIIVVELAPERGIGRAINDRLRRAAAVE